MHKHFLIAATASMALLLVGAVFAEENPDELTRQIWKQIQGKPNPRLMDNFELIEGFPLLVNGPDISPEATVLNATVEYQIGCDRVLSLAFKEAIRRAQEETGKSDREINDALNGLYPKGRLKKEEFALGQAQVRRKEWKTPLVRRSYLFELYLKEAAGYVAAARLFSRDAFVDVVIEEQQRVTWEKLKEAIDKKIPVMLKDGDSVKVAVGYYAEGDQSYLLVYDPTRAEYRIRTGLENVTERELKSKDPTAQASVRLRMSLKIPCDHILKLDSSLSPGVRWRPARNLEAASALYIYDWRADLEGLYPELLKRLGIDKEDGR